jgi:hypothetical protein
MPENNTITPLRFTLDEAIVIKAALLSVSHQYARLFLFSVVLGVAVSAVFFFQGDVESSNHFLMQAGLTVAATLVIALIVIIALRHWIIPVYARRNFRQQKLLSEESTLSWTDDEISYVTGKSRSEIPFADFHGYRTSDEVIILYLSDAIYHAIPVSAFGEPELRNAFVEKLDNAGVRRR